jgi:hypothetical protein
MGAHRRPRRSNARPRIRWANAILLAVFVVSLAIGVALLLSGGPGAPRPSFARAAVTRPIPTVRTPATTPQLTVPSPLTAPTTVGAPSSVPAAPVERGNPPTAYAARSVVTVPGVLNALCRDGTVSHGAQGRLCFGHKGIRYTL